MNRRGFLGWMGIGAGAVVGAATTIAKEGGFAVPAETDEVAYSPQASEGLEFSYSGDTTLEVATLWDDQDIEERWPGTPR